MILKKFAFGLMVKITLIILLSLALAYCSITIMQTKAAMGYWALAILLFAAIIYRAINLFTYTNSTNRKLARIFDSIRYDDFTIRFSSDNTYGKSFQDLNNEFNKVLGAFRKIRAENEASLHLVNTIIQNVQTGLILYDAYGRIELSNNAACKLLGFYRLKNLAELKINHLELAQKLTNNTSKHFLYQSKGGLQLSINIVAIRLGGQVKSLVSLHNIQPELQQKEVESWQNLTRVLRHEIMNSLTPILSLIGTMKHIVDKELRVDTDDNGAREDLQEALQTLEGRGIGMINFVDAYRSFTTIPEPILTEVNIEQLINRVINLFEKEIFIAGIDFNYIHTGKQNTVLADGEQLSMVLINLIKNSKEALQQTINGKIIIKSTLQNNQLIIEVTDNGPGIEPEAIEEIFIPFYTTKQSGSGIGLSLSRQIIQQHNGTIKVFSEGGNGCSFFVRLKLQSVITSV